MVFIEFKVIYLCLYLFKNFVKKDYNEREKER